VGVVSVDDQNGTMAPCRLGVQVSHNARMAPAYDFKLALTRVIEPTEGPGAELATLEEAARFVGLMKPWRQARPHWDFAGADQVLRFKLQLEAKQLDSVHGTHDNTPGC
jgi:hypothetical protein